MRECSAASAITWLSTEASTEVRAFRTACGDKLAHIIHHQRVAATVTGKAVGDGAQVQNLLGLAEFAQVQYVGVHIAFDLTHRTHHLDAAVAFCREGAHGEVAVAPPAKRMETTWWSTTSLSHRYTHRP